MTHGEDWIRRRPCVDYFRIFGSIAYAYISYHKRRKLDDKGEKCIFLGVSEKSKACKLYNPITKKTVISRDVIFYEEGFRDGMKSYQIKKYKKVLMVQMKKKSSNPYNNKIHQIKITEMLNIHKQQHNMIKILMQQHIHIFKVLKRGCMDAKLCGKWN